MSRVKSLKPAGDSTAFAECTGIEAMLAARSKATFAALRQLKNREDVASMRGKAVEEL